VITKQPSPVSVPVYRSATLAVAASGSETLTYQWYEENTIPAPDLAVAGATSATLTFPSVMPANSGTYRPQPDIDRFEFVATKQAFAACDKLMPMLHKPCCDDMRGQLESLCGPRRTLQLSRFACDLD
jgi:hypothetical protein